MNTPISILVCLLIFGFQRASAYTLIDGACGTARPYGQWGYQTRMCTACNTTAWECPIQAYVGSNLGDGVELECMGPCSPRFPVSLIYCALPDGNVACGGAGTCMQSSDLASPISSRKFGCRCNVNMCGPQCNVQWNSNSSHFISDQCQCQPGWTGDICADQCNAHGVTTPDGVCTCSTARYIGTMCEIDLLAIGVCMTPSANNAICNGVGSCSSDGASCTCMSGWGGPSCTIECNSHGHYSSAHGCTCDIGWAGSSCQNDLVAAGVCMSSQSNSTICNGHGACSNDLNVCACSLGWSGTSCDIPQCHSGTHGNFTLCNNNGLCTAVASIGSYCTCNPGWSNTFCDVPATPCDCGVVWSNPTSFISSVSPAIQMINAGAVVMSDDMIGLVNTQLEQEVGTVEQAKYICYISVVCDGFLLHVDGALRVIAAFFAYGPLSLTQKWSTYTNPSPSMYTIDRHSSNRCAHDSLDAAYYSQLHTSEIMQDCNHYTSNCTHESVYNKWTRLHWQHRGHIKRYNPSAACSLLPTLYDPLTACATPRVGCFGYPHPLTDTPCSGQGYCDASSGGSFQCNCDTFPGTLNPGVTLAGAYMYAGRACQYNVISSCSGALNGPDTGVDNGIQSVLCSGYIGACSADKVWDGVSAFNTTYSFDYHPRCHCDDQTSNPYPALGVNCQNSRCGDNVLRCNSAIDNGNTCVTTGLIRGGTDTAWACMCSDRWIGPQCQTDASACLHGGLQCSGHGTCVNQTQPQCQCHTSTYSGNWCEKQACPDAIMTVGHGECFNNILDHCFPVYQGSTCQVDVCALYNGTITPWSASDQYPKQCTCPPGSSASQPNDASCWPSCPTFNGAICGGSSNACDLTQSGGVRSAQCLCGQGYVATTDASGRGVCELYCVHGTFDPYASWDPHNPPACLCAGSGYNRARCDNPICQNNGIYNAQSNSCQCPHPFLPRDNCVSTTCNNAPAVDTLIRGQLEPTSNTCACNTPFAPLSPSNPYDCDGAYCGINGSPMSTWTHYMPARYMCACRGKFQSVCLSPFDPTACHFCSVTTCLNGGISNGDSCSCTFPFLNGIKGVCELSVCTNGSSGYNATSCICSAHYSGTTCNMYAPPLVVQPGPPVVVVPIPNPSPPVQPVVPVVPIIPPVAVIPPGVVVPPATNATNTNRTSAGHRSSVSSFAGVVLVSVLLTAIATVHL